MAATRASRPTRARSRRVGPAGRARSSAARRRLGRCSTMWVSSCDRVRSPMRAWDSSYSRSDSSVRRSASSRALLLLGHDLRHDEHDGDIDTERDPVLRRADRQRVVGRQEEEVEGEEARDRADSARHEAADHDADERGQHEDERRQGDAQMGAERQQDGQKYPEPGERRDNPEEQCAGTFPWYRACLVSRPSLPPGFRRVLRVYRRGQRASASRDGDERARDGEDEGVRPTGRFRVYLGSAAGVGKTCAMLDEGWRRFQRGADVVVGFVETHKRHFTVQQLRDLPVVPRTQISYRDAVWEEMDLDAVLARQPGGGADRRAGAHQRARVRPSRQALGGRPRDPRRRHRGHHDGEHPAHRVTGGRRRAHHRRRPYASGCRTGWCAGPIRSS